MHCLGSVKEKLLKIHHGVIIELKIFCVLNIFSSILTPAVNNNCSLIYLERHELHVKVKLKIHVVLELIEV